MRFWNKRIIVRNFSARVSEKIKQEMPFFIHRHPGSRVIQLKNTENDNLLTSKSLSMMKNLIPLFDENIGVSAIFFTSSSSRTLFSRGIDDNELKLHKDLVLYESNEFVGALANGQKATLVVYGGKCSGTAYSLFSGCKYTLGTPSTEISVDELRRGYLPFGGLAYRFARGCPEGIAAARYYGCSNAIIYGGDSYGLGLVSHLVGNEPEESLTDALAHTISPNFLSKAKQHVPVDIDALPELLDALHADCDVDISTDPAWNEVFLVSPDEELEGYKELEPDDDDIEVIVEDLKQCFTTDSPEEAVKNLEKLCQETRPRSTAWARNCIQTIGGTHPLLVKAWFQLTRIAETNSLENVLSLENRANSILLSNPLYEDFVAKTSTQDIIADLQSVSARDVEGLFRDRQP